METKNRIGGAGGGVIAKDALGNDIFVDEWLKTHGPGDRTLAQGLKVSNMLCTLISISKYCLTKCFFFSFKFDVFWMIISQKLNCGLLCSQLGDQLLHVILILNLFSAVNF